MKIEDLGPKVKKSYFGDLNSIFDETFDFSSLPYE